MIIDCHCHAGKGDGLTGPWDTRAPLDRYLRRADGGRHRRARCSSPRSIRTTRSPTARWRASSRASPERFSASRSSMPSATRAGRRAGPRGGRALRLPRHQGAPPRRAHHARDLRGGAGVAAAGALRRDGRGLGRRAAGRASTRTSRSSSRTWAALPTTGGRSWRSSTSWSVTRTSTPTPRAFAVSICSPRRCERAGPRKVLFGSDGPWLHPGVELAKIEALGDTAADDRYWVAICCGCSADQGAGGDSSVPPKLPAAVKVSSATLGSAARSLAHLALRRTPSGLCSC